MPEMIERNKILNMDWKDAARLLHEQSGAMTNLDYSTNNLKQ
jgi:hypothetical protein